MDKVKKNRTRNTMISFRVSDDEKKKIEARIKISGLNKSEYFINTFLNQDIIVNTGLYYGDRLSLELNKLLIYLMEKENNQEDKLDECKYLLEEILSIIKEKKSSAND